MSSKPVSVTPRSGSGYGNDELAVAGGIRNRPVDLVGCKKIPLKVSADAET